MKILCRKCFRDPCDCPEVRYREEKGKDPGRLPADDPLAWQWEQTSRQELRERLRREFGLERDEPDDGPPPVIEGQETLL